MSCTCHKTPCCCQTYRGPKGPAGPRGPQGPQGIPGQDATIVWQYIQNDVSQDITTQAVITDMTTPLVSGEYIVLFEGAATGGNVTATYAIYLDGVQQGFDRPFVTPGGSTGYIPLVLHYGELVVVGTQTLTVEATATVGTMTVTRSSLLIQKRS